MANENLTLRIGADTKDAQIELKQLQAAILQVRADKLGAEFVGDKQAADAFRQSLRALNVTLADLKAEKAFDALGQGVEKNSKIAKEALTTLSSEVIESWGVDGDIANELGRMFTDLPKGAIAAGVAIVGAFVVTAAAIAGVVAVASQMIDVAGEVGTKSKEDFDKFAKSAREAGVEITTTDRALSQELLRSVEQVKAASDGLFLVLIRESGPELNELLKTTTKFLKEMVPVAKDFGYVLSEAFIYASAGLRTFIQTRELLAIALNNPTVGLGLLSSIGVDQFLSNVKIVREEIEKLRNTDLPPATFDSKEKGPDREAARERAEKLLDRMNAERQRDVTQNLRDNDVLRAATDAYVRSLNIKIDRQKGFVALIEGQSREYVRGVNLAIEAGRELFEMQTRTAEIELQRLGTFFGNEVVIAQARAELERQNENARYEIARREIETNIENNATKVEALRLYHAQLEELERQHQATLAEIKRSEQLTTERGQFGTARNVFGDAFADELQRNGARMRAFAALVKDVSRSASADIGNLGTIGSRAFGSLAAGLGEVVRNFVLTGQTGPAALRRVTAAVLAEVAQQAAVKAIFELAAGFASLFLNPAEAAAHFQAAALYGSVAAVAGVAGRAVAPAAAAAGGGALGNQLANNSAANQSTETQYRYVDRDGRGVAQGNLIITIKTDQAQQIANVERAAITSYRQGGALRQITDNANGGLPITTG